MNKENQSNNANNKEIKCGKLNIRKRNKKSTNKIKVVKNNDKVIIVHIHNKMPALWDSKVTFVLVSHFGVSFVLPLLTCLYTPWNSAS